MLAMLASHLLCSWFVFLQPCYSTFKTLSRATPHTDLQIWCMYWAVVGTFIAVENIFGVFMSWLPFYWELRTLFLLYLSLPQIQVCPCFTISSCPPNPATGKGSTYVYKTYLEPFCRINEAEFDAGIASATSSILDFFQSCVTSVTDVFFSLLNQTPVTTQPQSDRAYDTGTLN
ncbi:TB2/DP1, HVA22 family-domain-containing protein [Pisolithus croceorrhizus]|nr:TB2/DP1, HVA22 family-domain-containing protein [Pisolithus croceorrhizus]